MKKVLTLLMLTLLTSCVAGGQCSKMKKYRASIEQTINPYQLADEKQKADC